MKPAVFIPEKYASRYGLLGSFCAELGRGFGAEGFEVNPAASARVNPRVFVFFNNPPPLDQLYGWTGGPESGRVIVQWCVDHPLTMPASVLDQLTRDPGYRLLTVADDDLHLVQMRWAGGGGVRAARCWHGVDEAALCDVEIIEKSHAAPPHAERGDTQNQSRDIDVLVAGWIASESELVRLRGVVPEVLRESCDEIVRLRVDHPRLSFGHAYDIAMPMGLRVEDPWRLMSLIFAYTTAAVNRVRRLMVIDSLRGLSVGLLGDAGLRELEGDGVRYLGEAAYAELPGWLKRTKVSIALGPTQFVHSFSERLLLSLAAGCATVADDRHWVREQFGRAGADCVEMFPIERPAEMRAMVVRLLGDVERRAVMGAAGREVVAREHLWRHRVPVVLGVAGVQG